MSREIENITASFRKARKEGEQLLSDGRICWEDFCCERMSDFTKGFFFGAFVEFLIILLM